MSPAPEARALLDPVAFARIALGHDVWSTPAAILRSVAANPRTAVKACHAPGKTFTAAEAVLWWITRWDDAIAVTTAPTWTQVEQHLWGEIRRSAMNARIRYPKPLTTELKLAEGNYAIGLSTNEGVRFQGFHAPHLLIVLDEAVGVRPDVWEAIEGARAGGDVSVLALGNPTVPSGPFHDAFTINRDTWATFTISALDTPNLAGLSVEQLIALPDEQLDIAPRPYLVRRRWVKEKYHEWGVGHPLWDSRVLGQFPAQSESALFSVAWVEAARLRDLPEPRTMEFEAGLDVAGPGESETSLYIRRGPRILHHVAWTKADPRGEVVAELRKWGNPRTKIDSAGIGWGMYCHLKDLGIPVEAVNVGERPRDTEQFKNLKAELYWGLRSRFRDGDIAGLTDERTAAQLLSIEWRQNPRGQTEIETKEEAAKRGVKSPDRAEALMLAFADVHTAMFPEFSPDRHVVR